MTQGILLEDQSLVEGGNAGIADIHVAIVAELVKGCEIQDGDYETRKKNKRVGKTAVITGMIYNPFPQRF